MAVVSLAVVSRQQAVRLLPTFFILSSAYPGLWDAALNSLSLGLPNGMYGNQVDSLRAVFLRRIHFNNAHLGPACRPDVRAKARTHMNFF